MVRVENRPPTGTGFHKQWGYGNLAEFAVHRVRRELLPQCGLVPWTAAHPAPRNTNRRLMRDVGTHGSLKVVRLLRVERKFPVHLHVEDVELAGVERAENGEDVRLRGAQPPGAAKGMVVQPERDEHRTVR